MKEIENFEQEEQIFVVKNLHDKNISNQSKKDLNDLNDCYNENPWNLLLESQHAQHPQILNIKE